REAWWWLGVPGLFAIWLLVTWQIAPGWYSKWVIPEGYGILEFSQFVTMLAALFIAVRLLFKPFVRKRPFVFAVTIISALSCLYIAGEEMSWGQHFFHWKTPEYWAMVNRQEETNLHNIYPAFEQWPRAVLEIGIVIGGIIVPIAAAFFPRIPANRLSLFLPPAALLPTRSSPCCSSSPAFSVKKDICPSWFTDRARRSSSTCIISSSAISLSIYARRIK